MLSFEIVGGIPVIFSALLYPLLLILLWYIISLARGSS
jgi:general stress protein CsbA